MPWVHIPFTSQSFSTSPSSARGVAPRSTNGSPSKLGRCRLDPDARPTAASVDKRRLFRVVVEEDDTRAGTRWVLRDSEMEGEVCLEVAQNPVRVSLKALQARVVLGCLLPCALCRTSFGLLPHSLPFLCVSVSLVFLDHFWEWPQSPQWQRCQ